MDFERDYILRLIQMLGELMRRIAEKLDDRERRRMLDDTCHTFCGMSLTAGETLSAESLTALLAPLPRLWMSELLADKARVCELPPGEAEELNLKALRLLASLHAESQLCDLRAQRLSELKQAAFAWLTAADLMNCARFFSQAERYDEMEDALFQALALEAGDVRERDRQEAIVLLRQAARADTRTLILCRMTGEELRASARELETLPGAPNAHEGENTR